MKQTHYKHLGVISIFLMAIAIIVSCSREELTKDLNLYVGSEFLVNPITLQVFDAQDASKIPTGATISIEGRDKDKIYSLMGEKNLSLIDGLVALAVKKVDVPTENSPLEFSVVISAPNYLTKQIDYNLKTSESSLSDIALINVATPPTGVTIAQNQFKSNATTGVTAKVQINSSTNTQAEASQVVVPATTRMLTKEGKEVTGTIQSLIVHSNAKSALAISEIPGWASAVKVKKEDGIINENVIEPAGFFELKMQAGTDKVERFSAPIEAVSYIDPNTFNPEMGRKIQAGDVLTILSLSEGEDAWKEEGKATIQKAENGKLKVNFNLNHLSHYTYCWKRSYCRTSLKVSSGITNWTQDYRCSQPLKEYYYEIVDADDKNKVFEKGWSTFGNGASLDKADYPNNKKVKVIIYENKKSSTPLYTTAAITACNNNIVYLPANALPKDNSVLVKVNVSGVCKGSINTTFLPSASILYRELNNPNSKWEHLVTLVPGDSTSTGCARGLVEGKTYDFAVAVNLDGKNELLTFSKTLRQPQGLVVKEQTIKVHSDYWGYTSANGFVEDFVIKKAPGTNMYILNYPNCPLPEKVCTEIDKNFSAFVKKKKK